MDFSNIYRITREVVCYISWLLRISVKALTLSGFNTTSVYFIIVSGNIILSGVYYVIGSKYYNFCISSDSSRFDGGYFENRYMHESHVHHWLKLLHYRDVFG